MQTPYVAIPQRGPNGQVILGPDGQPVTGIAPNPPKHQVRSYWLTPRPVSVVLGPLGTGEVTFTVDQEGHFDWTHLIGSSTGLFALEFFDPGEQRRLQNRPIASTTILGTGRRPFKLPEAYFFNVGDAERKMVVSIRDLTGTSNTVRIILYGRRYFHREAEPRAAIKLNTVIGEGWRTNTYFLAAREASATTGLPPDVPAGGTATFTFDADREAETDVIKAMAFADGAFSYRLREATTNRILSNGFVHRQNGWGNAEFPFYFASGYLFERDKRLVMDVQDLSGAPNTVIPTLAARRLEYKA